MRDYTKLYEDSDRFRKLFGIFKPISQQQQSQG